MTRNETQTRAGRHAEGGGGGGVSSRHDELGGTVDRRCNKVDKEIDIGRHSEIDEERDTPARVVVVGQW